MQCDARFEFEQGESPNSSWNSPKFDKSDSECVFFVLLRLGRWSRFMSVCISSASVIPSGVAVDLSTTGSGGGGMSLSHLSVSSSVMQPLVHPLLSNMPGLDQQNVVSAMAAQPQFHHHPVPTVGSMVANGSDHLADHPSPDMLLALIARNKALEGKCGVVIYDGRDRGLWESIKRSITHNNHVHCGYRWVGRPF